MLNEQAQLNELPKYWQDKVRSLRSENYSLRKRLKEKLNKDNMPPEWLKIVTDLRDECAVRRIENVQLRAELAGAR